MLPRDVAAKLRLDTFGTVLGVESARNVPIYVVDAAEEPELQFCPPVV